MLQPVGIPYRQMKSIFQKHLIFGGNPKVNNKRVYLLFYVVTKMVKVIFWSASIMMKMFSANLLWAMDEL